MKLSAFTKSINSLSVHKPKARDAEGNVKEKMFFLRILLTGMFVIPLSLILHISQTSQRALRQKIRHWWVLRG